ncbi:uncharacterized protein MONBRDRAFT_32441 [Monosiga brevicollis MX1]|uniref:Aspergillus nuclease S(1) n=1 Tax=Monosiga brevicollis TaxID=81824 RepID=A9UZI8_MONBE|nr:uncharacterized protein MONBRDRAFT_32441 [Monosiga brevicollis MX1]EDQ89376.1 predicted protein [Monosiga brevicollis MX1]|eukprot:XP_001745952.1 hypothetical protein [Monosiga brevicollis MX1]
MLAWRATMAPTWVWLLLFTAGGAQAWGPIGHQTTAAIAETLLTEKAATTVAQILDNASMVSVSTWADDVRSTSAWAWSAPLHFIDTPDRVCSFDYSRDCQNDGRPDFCVAGAIVNYTRQLELAVAQGRLQDETTQEALKFVIHFLGDIHQPLHVSFTSDEGGNLVNVTFFGEPENLHVR